MSPSLNDGGYVVTWQGPDGSGTGIYAQRYDANSNPLGSETRINTTRQGNQAASDVAALSDGGYVVTWQSAGQDGSGTGIYAQRYNANGSPVGSETLVNTTTANDQTVPAVTALHEGGYVVTWQSAGQDGAVASIHAQRFDADGNPVKLAVTVLTITGDNLDNTLVGNEAANTLTGLGGDDSLDGAGGADTLIGGNGNDIYYVDNVGDVVIETSTTSTEIDVVNSSVSFDLGDNIENLALTGTATIDGTGNALANLLTGNSNNNTLDGGTGADAMTGGLGNDTYIVDDEGDVVIETSASATEIDTVQSSVSFTLGNNQENLWLTGVDAVNGTGNLLNNLLSGNVDGNVLDGMAGIDTVTYEDAETRVEVNLGLGNYQYTVGDGFNKLINIENLIGSAYNDRLTGNDQANSLAGGTGDDTLIGGDGNDKLYGGAGGDLMQGGAGNDTYYFNNGDYIEETSTLASEIDTVVSPSSYVLGGNLEHLTLTGNANIFGIGNELDNKLIGNAKNNMLESASGNDFLFGKAGMDILTGGSGNDTFTFDTALGAGNVDTLTDFGTGADKIRLDDDIFRAFNAGTSTSLGVDQFYAASGATAAADANDRIVYDTATGNLYYDADGVGGTGAVRFAVLTGGVALTATDFLIMA